MEIELVNVHLAILCLTAVAILMADHDAFSYLRGKKPILDPVRTKRLHYTVTAGLTGMILTGAFLFKDAWGELLYLPQFYVKMCMVLALIANSFVIGELMHVAFKTPYKDLPQKERLKLQISGAISGLCWVGAATIGYFFL